MRVLAAIIVPPHLSVSGAARAAEKLSGALAPKCDMTIGSMLGKGIDSPGVKRVPVRSWLPPVVPWSRFPGRYSTLFYRSDLPEIIRRERFDLVHLHNPMPALELERAANACLAEGIPYVISTHGFNEVANGLEVYGFGLAKRLMWKNLVSDPVARVVSKASAVFALSPADFGIVRDMGFSGGELTVVTNGVELPREGDRDNDAERLAVLGIPERRSGQITCAFLANHTPNKGLPILLKAFLATKTPGVLIVGGERRGDIDYDSFIRGCGPDKQIIVTGRLEDRDIGAVFRRSDMFVFPTLADTFPLVVLEAMSYGLPVVASSVGGIPHQLDDDCGMLVTAGNVGELAATIDMLAADPARRQAMGRNALLRVAREFTWEQAANNAFVAYQRILHQHQGAIGAQPADGGRDWAQGARPRIARS